MPTIHRTVTSALSPGDTFAYLVDFENATEWDSGTKTCHRVSGDGGPGTVYRNVSTFVGREVALDYTVDEVGERRFVITGRNDTTTSHDTIVVSPNGSGSAVDYTADFTFAGPARFLGPLMSPLLARLGDKTADQLRKALDSRAG